MKSRGRKCVYSVRFGIKTFVLSLSLSFRLKLKAKANMLDNVLVLVMLNSQHFNKTFKRILKIKKYKWLIRYEMTVHN